MSNSDTPNKIVGIIAGGGVLPFIVAEEVLSAGLVPVIAGLKGFVSRNLESLASRYALVEPGRLRDCISYLKESGAEETVMCGHIDHRQVFNISDVDDLMLSVLKEMDKRAESLLKRIADTIEDQGLPVAELRKYLGKHLLKEGVYGAGRINKEVEADLDFGLPIAQKLAELNIGQSIMIRSGVIVAVEAIEGTDKMINRAADLNVPGCVVIKLPMKNKDPRFDLPVIGSKTIESMKRAASPLIAVSADNTILVEPRKSLKAAEDAGITIIARALPQETEK